MVLKLLVAKTSFGTCPFRMICRLSLRRFDLDEVFSLVRILLVRIGILGGTQTFKCLQGYLEVKFLLNLEKFGN
jgi:hypothetical protein